MIGRIAQESLRASKKGGWICGQTKQLDSAGTMWLWSASGETRGASLVICHYLLRFQILKVLFQIFLLMVKMNVLSDCLRSIVNAERQGRKQVLIRPVSKLVIKFLQVMQRQGYIGEFEVVDDHRSGKIVVELLGRINKCGVISPRYDVTLQEFEKWANNILPARQFGCLVLTTNVGILTHEEARHRHIGGKVLGFFY